MFYLCRLLGYSSDPSVGNPLHQPQVARVRFLAVLHSGVLMLMDRWVSGVKVCVCACVFLYLL